MTDCPFSSASAPPPWLATARRLWARKWDTHGIADYLNLPEQVVYQHIDAIKSPGSLSARIAALRLIAPTHDNVLRPSPSNLLAGAENCPSLQSTEKIREGAK